MFAAQAVQQHQRRSVEMFTVQAPGLPIAVLDDLRRAEARMAQVVRRRRLRVLLDEAREIALFVTHPGAEEEVFERRERPGELFEVRTALAVVIALEREA